MPRAFFATHHLAFCGLSKTVTDFQLLIKMGQIQRVIVDVAEGVFKSAGENCGAGRGPVYSASLMT